MDTKMKPATPLTERVLSACSIDSEHTDLSAYHAMTAHAQRMERDRAKLVAALRLILIPETVRDYEQFKKVMDESRALLKDLGE